MHAAVEHLAKDIDDRAAHAGETLGQGISPQQHHGARDVLGERLSYSDRVRAQQIQLQLAILFGSDAHVAQLADAGSDGIGELVVLDERIDDGTRPVHQLAGIRLEEHWPVLINHVTHIIES